MSLALTSRTLKALLPIISIAVFSPGHAVADARVKMALRVKAPYIVADGRIVIPGWDDATNTNTDALDVIPYTVFEGSSQERGRFDLHDISISTRPFNIPTSATVLVIVANARKGEGDIWPRVEITFLNAEESPGKSSSLGIATEYIQSRSIGETSFSIPIIARGRKVKILMREINSRPNEPSAVFIYRLILRGASRE